MIPFLMALSCLTNITKDCSHPTPIMNYQLKHIWSPTNPFFAKAMENGTWTTSKKPPDMRALRGVKLKVAILEARDYITIYYCH
ncbi:unnamed protein product [Allacma fusca]|uniref:Uncharacterized protein n=1 Tax=Allacma fusca TaxID=39272 RepID=A0A8J2PVB5_9HEXA|nr:unnamed protein product [Allacma fusca]